MPTSTVENYLKQIHHLQQHAPGPLVSMGKLAEAVGVSPGTATAMIKTLGDSGLVDYEPRGGVRLSNEGERLALHVLRRHRLIELFLVDVLGLDWTEVHVEAEVLEHAISDKVLDRIDRLLGHPTTDPHGDPIPTAAGTLSHQHYRSLVECGVGEIVRIRRLSDQDPSFLQFMDQHGLTPGIDMSIVARSDAAEAVTVRPDGGRDITVGRGAAAKVLVESMS